MAPCVEAVPGAATARSVNCSGASALTSTVPGTQRNGTVKISVFAEPLPKEPTVVKVTEATLTYVAIDGAGRPRPVPRDQDY